uniref:Uncharacterized protein n=1 Tax=Siphoviridae sp. ct3gT1 TaxID=2825323 RepID=A0A8S5UJD8_9CAUD|nr:MAG TPA: hypothetical protein [Siphoviridae sp. ct3gT1]
MLVGKVLSRQKYFFSCSLILYMPTTYKSHGSLDIFL